MTLTQLYARGTQGPSLSPPNWQPGGRLLPSPSTYSENLIYPQMARNRIEKLALNNQIVSMRKDVKRARLWLVNNLNQRVRKLNERKGTEREIEKNLRKSERLRREIQHLKDVDIDEVSKFALCNKQEFTTNNNLLELDQQALLRLANHEIVQKQVVKFRQSYAIPIDRLILLVRSLGLQYQKKKKKIMQTAAEDALNSAKVSTIENEIGEKKTNISTTQDIISKSKKSGTSTKRTSNTLSQKNILAVEPEVHKISSNSSLTDQELQTLSLESSVTCRNANNDNILSEVNSVHSVSNTGLPINRDAYKKIPWPKLSVPQIDKKVGSMEIKQIHLDQCDAESIFLDQSNKIDDCTQNITDLHRDSFFLGGVDIPSENDDDEGGSAPLHSMSRLKLIKGDPSVRPSRKKALRGETVSSISRFSKDNSSQQISSSVSDPVVEVLHPSWQAKRKEKEFHISVSGCQGKKIKFDDN